MSPFTVAINVCAEGECQNLFRAPERTLKSANERFNRLMTGEENYGQFLYDPRKFGVMLSITRNRDGKRLRTMQIN